MNIYSYIQSLYHILLDQLFPKHPRVLALEEKVHRNTLGVLPPAGDIPTPHCSALFSYRDSEVRELVWQIKYQKNKILTDAIGKLLYETILADVQDSVFFEDHEKIFIIPIPSTRKRRFERGGNQSDRLVRAILDQDNQSIFEYAPDTVQKIRETVSQTKTKNRAERLKNLVGAFAVSETEKIKRKRVLLIDDVITTGSTLNEMRKVLRKAGAKSVECYVIAH